MRKFESKLNRPLYTIFVFIHQTVLTYLETAFRIDHATSRVRRLPNYPEILDSKSVMGFFNNHPALQAEEISPTEENLAAQLNGEVPDNGTEEPQDLLMLLVLGFVDDETEIRDDVALVYHKPTGVLFPGISGAFVRLCRKHCQDFSHRGKRLLNGQRKLTNLVRGAANGNRKRNWNPIPIPLGIFRITRRVTGKRHQRAEQTYQFGERQSRWK